MLFAAPAHDYTRRLINAEPDGSPVPLPEPAAPLLTVRGLSVAFEKRRGLLRRVAGYHHALKDLSFTLHAGESLGLVGESGSGKSTS
ncbi:ATP-binding cassette domain-containing protein, partial [Klebsiella pneumoniae]|nr:ATP-binding cassette domain-containing protein [Klebsiella pneumoniae]